MSKEDNFESEYRLAEQYLLNREYENAYNILQEISETNIGYAYNAKFWLGEMYYYGWFVEQNYEKAYEYFKQSQHPDSYYYIGLMYYYGEYLEQNDEEAFRIFSMLEQNPRARYMLGVMCYEKGDFKEAFNLLTSVETTNLKAKYIIGKMYCYGYYVEKDYNKAREIFSELIETNNPYAVKNASHMLEMIKYFEDGTIPSDGIQY